MSCHFTSDRNINSFCRADKFLALRIITFFYPFLVKICHKVTKDNLEVKIICFEIDWKKKKHISG